MNIKNWVIFFILLSIIIGIIFMFNFNKNVKDKKVIVVGAGISGLAAANKLNQEGFEVLVLEAKDYVGGRIKSENVNGENFEIGASWIHGDKNNPVAEILKQEGAKLVPTNFATSVFYKNGQKVEIDEDNLSGFYSILDKEKENGEKDISLMEVWDKFVEKNKNKYSIEELKDLWHILAFDIETEVGTDMKNISTWEYAEEEEMKGGDKLVVGGYNKVISHLANGLDIRLNTIVNKVEDKGNKVIVTSTSGENFEADEVIVTVPLGVLQKGTITFIPVLPDYKQKAINSLNMGNLHKTFITFDKKSWDDVDTISILNDDNSKWGDFINVEPVFGKPILLVLHAGENAKSLENKSDEELGEEAYEKLKSIYKDATKPTTVVTSKWYADPFTLGSYSYVPPGATLSMYDDIAKPFGNIHFAGEHTTSEYPSTTHGAYLSGLRAAKEIVSR